jgi:Flp pilus assembly protein TadD
MSDSTYSLFQQGRERLSKGMPAQATVPLEKAKRREPEKASIREALGIDYAHYALGRALEKQGKAAEANGHYKLASSLRPQSRRYASRIRDLEG